MAEVPLYQRRVQDRAVGTTFYRNYEDAASKGGAVAAGLSDIGRGGLNIAQAIAARNKVDATREADFALQALRTPAREAMLDPNKGYLSQSGLNATKAGYTSLREKLVKERDKIAASLGPEAREQFMLMSEDFLQDKLDQGAKHLAGEQKSATLTTADAAVKGFQTDAVDSWADDARFLNNLEKARQKQAATIQLSGLGKEAVAAADKRLVSETWMARLVRVAESNPLLAQQLLDDNRDQLITEDELRLTQALKPIVTRERARNEVARFNKSLRIGGATPLTGHAAKLQLSMGPSRPLPPNQKVTNALQVAVGATFGPGATVIITSGKEHEGRQAGAPRRHPWGLAADFKVRLKDGTLLNTNDPRMEQMVFALARAGFTSLGFDTDGSYMGVNGIHADMLPPERYAPGQGEMWEGWTNNPKLVQAWREGKKGAAPSEYWTQVHLGPLGGRLVQYATANEKNRGMLAKRVFTEMGEGAAFEELKKSQNWIDDNISVGDMLEGWGNLHGDVPVTQGDTYDFSAAYTHAINLADDPALQAAYIAEVELLQQLTAKARAANIEATRESVFERFLTTGDTSLSVMEQLALGETALAGIKSYMTAHQNGELVTDAKLLDDLKLMSISNNPATRMSFAAPGSIEKHRANLSVSDYDNMIRMRDVVRGEMAGAAADKDERIRNADVYAVKEAAEQREYLKASVAAALGPVYGTSNESRAGERDALLHSLEKQLADEMETYIRENGTPMPYARARAWIDLQTMPVQEQNVDAGTGWGNLIGMGGPQRFFELQRLPDGSRAPELAVEIGDISMDDRSHLRVLLQSILAPGMAITDDAITTAYENRALALAGEPLQAMDIPNEALTFLLSAYRDADGNIGMGIEDARNIWEIYVAGILTGNIDPSETLAEALGQ